MFITLNRTVFPKGFEGSSYNLDMLPKFMKFDTKLEKKKIV